MKLFYFICKARVYDQMFHSQQTVRNRTPNTLLKKFSSVYTHSKVTNTITQICIHAMPTVEKV